MAKRAPRYEFSVNWLAEQSYQRNYGVGNPRQDSYSTLTVAELSYYEQMRQDSLAYHEMEQGER